ncbi:MAG: motility protein A [Microthrixaceae bacterium]|nr:motility protein A [Microthrixaceae bacterium]MCO5312271.1 motility protein A [Microthrixaceae bacterium]HPB44435.1 motility protein A [Microthrixaceae bacterium]
MDPATLLGLALVLVGVFVGAILDGVSPMTFFATPAAFLIVLLSALGATFFSNTMADAKALPKVLIKGIKGQKLRDNGELIDQIVSFAEMARREGLLALEDQAKNIEDPFFRRGLQLAIDGADPDMVSDVMEADITAMSARHKQGSKMMTSIGIYSPTFGIIGAVIGLIHTMHLLDSPSELGQGIAGAFTATFWGVFAANGIFLPLGNKLAVMSAVEIAQKRLIAEGVLSIQSGANPRLLDDMLRSSLPPSERGDADKKSA